MLPIVLVLFVATSAFAAPSVSLSLQPIQQTSRPYDTGVGLNGGLIAQLFELVDGGDLSVYSTYLNQIVQDLGSQRDSRAQALAASQAIAILGELAYGVSGDACSASQAINQYVANPNGGGRSFVSTHANYIDAIATLASNPASIRNASPPSGNCNGAGRTYQFEAAWDSILNAASPYYVGLVNEEYCATKRLYNSWNQRSNSIAAAATAASLPTVVDSVHRNLPTVVNFLRAAASGNAYAYASSAKQAISS